MKNIGGGEIFLFNFLEKLNNNKFIILSPSGNVYDKLVNQGYYVIKFNLIRKIYRNELKIKNSFLFLISIIVCGIYIPFIVRKQKIDLIITNGFFPSVFTLLLFRQKILLIQHLIHSEKRLRNFEFLLLNKKINFIVCVSNAVKNSLLKLNISEKKITTIHNSINISEIIPTSINSHYDKINIGLIGRITRIKNIVNIVLAIKDMLSDNVKILIYGINDNDSDSLKYFNEVNNIISKYNLFKYVFLMGFEENINKIYQSVEIVINYSLVPEAFPYSVLESMAYGKIVISSDNGGQTEMIDDKISGFLVAHDNSASLSDTVSFVIDLYKTNPNYINKVKSNAFKKVLSQFSDEKFIRKYSELFENI